MQMGPLRRLSLAGLVALLVLAPAGKSRSLELGLTPNHVYALWLNINRSLLSFARILSERENNLQELTEMRPTVFKNKVPADVYAHAKEFGALLNGYILIPTQAPNWLVEYEKSRGDASDTNQRITPSAVFLISTQLLNAIVDVVVLNTGWEQPVSEFYAIEQYTEKTSSDVYGLVDLALRRAKIILAEANQ